MKIGLAAMILASPAFAWGATYYEQTFSSDDELSEMSLEYDGPVELSSSYYRNLPELPMEARWFASRVGSHGICALYGSHSSDGQSGPARMISPAIEVGEGAALRWSARSLLPRLPESYAVLAREKGETEWTELYATEAESYRWQDRCVSLSEWEGRTVECAIECRSENAFLLAIDDFKLGLLPSVEFAMRTTLPVFVTPEDNEFAIDVQNIGSPYEMAGLRVFIDGELEYEEYVDMHIASADDVRLTYHVDLSVGQVSSYKFVIFDTNGKETTLASGTMACNDFAKALFVDKGTGTWCNNCPQGDLALQGLSDTYGEQMIIASTHTGDLMNNTSYFSALGFTAVPNYMIDRRDEYVCSSSQLKSNLAAAAALPVTIGIESQVEMGTDNVKMTAIVKSSEYVDNREGNLRVGCVLLGDFNETAAADSRLYSQSNTSVTATAGDYLYYLPTYIPGDMWSFEHITLSSATAFTGIAKSLPEELSPWQDYECSYTLAMPEKASDAENLTLVVYVIDTSSGNIANSCKAINVGDSELGSVLSALADTDTGTHWYTLQGLPISTPMAPGVYIRVQGASITKVAWR